MPIVQADRLTRIGAALLRAAGASNDDIILGPEFETDHETHGDTLYSQDPPEEDS